MAALQPMVLPRRRVESASALGAAEPEAARSSASPGRKMLRDQGPLARPRLARLAPPPNLASLGSSARSTGAGPSRPDTNSRWLKRPWAEPRPALERPIAPPASARRLWVPAPIEDCTRGVAREAEKSEGAPVPMNQRAFGVAASRRRYLLEEAALAPFFLAGAGSSGAGSEDATGSAVGSSSGVGVNLTRMASSITVARSGLSIRN